MVCQNQQIAKATYPTFSSTEMNAKLKEAFQQEQQQSRANGTVVQPSLLSHRLTGGNGSSSPAAVIKKMEELKKLDVSKLTHTAGGAKIYDTVFVGGVAHDTLRISGIYTHNGPIMVFNDGVLIIKNAIVNNTGDLFVFNYGRVLVDSSQVTFPQQYFYQRNVIAIQHGYINFHYSTFAYSGMSHGLVMGDSAIIDMNLVHNYDWTTAGLYGSPTVNIRGSNLGGEYILAYNATANFNNVDSLLLWHMFPNLAVINYVFPPGAAVYGYHFNNTVAGVSGINYAATADSCYNVWWGMMPSNGSDVTISNSTIRAIGALFQRGDSVWVNGVYDNSSYTNYVMPVADRNLHLINSGVQTWSFYLSDSSKVKITNCTLGEVGTQQRSSVGASQTLVDGSGGYFWASDTSTTFAGNCTSYNTVRSERYGIFVYAYGNIPFTGPTSIGHSVMVSVQNTMAADPVPYDGSICWMENIATPAAAHADSVIAVTGSAWIDQGPNGSWFDWMSYSLSYQLIGNTGWIYIVSDSVTEIRHNTLANWNTTGLAAGTYILRLVNKSTLGDTVEDFKAVTILPAATVLVNENADFKVSCYPNPATDVLNVESNTYPVSGIRIYNVLGEIVYESAAKLNKTMIDIHTLDKGIYSIEFTANQKICLTRLVKE